MSFKDSKKKGKEGIEHLFFLVLYNFSSFTPNWQLDAAYNHNIELGCLHMFLMTSKNDLCL